jgi:hypothetical protein
LQREERKNQFTYENVNEEIDNTNKDIIEQLIYTRDGNSPQVKKAIASFIKDN